MIYICEGNDKEKLNQFKTINIAGEQLTTQELRTVTVEKAISKRLTFPKTSKPHHKIRLFQLIPINLMIRFPCATRKRQTTP